MQIFDHVGIYLLIAGSYSPFMMIALHHNTSANVLLVVQWLTAFIGICVTIATAGIGASNQVRQQKKIQTQKPNKSLSLEFHIPHMALLFS
jgi:predicted membrane channel-forming protein YqfA (hemolysin III family)